MEDPPLIFPRETRAGGGFMGFPHQTVSLMQGNHQNTYCLLLFNIVQSINYINYNHYYVTYILALVSTIINNI